jgi:hypothetical protein
MGAPLMAGGAPVGGSGAIAGSDAREGGAFAGAATGGRAAGMGAGAGAAAAEDMSLPHVRQNCICLGLSVPQRVQRDAIGFAAGAAAL